MTASKSTARHGYYLESFVSRVWNRRDDQYGPQSLENRTRLPLEIIAGLRERLGADYPLGLRMNGQEWGADKGLTIAETVAIAKIFEGAGVRYISVSGYGFGPLPFRYLPDYWPYPEPGRTHEALLEGFHGRRPAHPRRCRHQAGCEHSGHRRRPS